MIIDGKALASQILTRIAALPRPEKFFSAVLVGDDAASTSFLQQKQNVAKLLGVDFRLYRFPSDTNKDDLREEIRKVAAHKTCGGVILQCPLPNGLDPQYVLNAIPREKDVDVLGERALGAFYAGRSAVLPPAAGTVEEIFSMQKVSVDESFIAIVGCGMLVGRPIASHFMKKAKMVAVLEKGSDFGILKSADVVVLGTGHPALVNAAMLKPGAGVIDFGYGTADRKVMGDFDPSGADSLSFYTPTPGGTGPILVAKLFENFYLLNLR